MHDTDMISESSNDDEYIGCHDMTTHTTSQEEASSEARDEIKEIRKLSAKDTAWIRRWRYTVLILLLVTAVTITFITYRMLINQENENFVTAVRKKKNCSTFI